MRINQTDIKIEYRMMRNRKKYSLLLAINSHKKKNKNSFIVHSNQLLLNRNIYRIAILYKKKRSITQFLYITFIEHLNMNKILDFIHLKLNEFPTSIRSEKRNNNKFIIYWNKLYSINAKPKLLVILIIMIYTHQELLG